MALYDPVNGVYRKVSKKYDPVDGVYRKVTKAFDPVDGAYRQYFSSDLTAGGLAVGDSIWLNVDGTLTEFLVVHQGNPDSVMYDASCDGTWLLMKDCYRSYAWDSDNYNDYSTSDVHDIMTYFPGNLTSTVKAAIKTVKIPYGWYPGPSLSVSFGANGLSTKCFLLSACEMGFDWIDYDNLPKDGACLEYFVGATNDTRKANYSGGYAANYWLRSPCTDDYERSFHVASYGGLSSDTCDTSFGYRPAFILDSSTPIDNSTGINIIA